MRKAAVIALVLGLVPACVASAVSAESYTASVNGFGGEISVTLTIEDGTITDAQVTGAAETDGIGSKAVEQMPAQILEAQTWEVDGVSGATVSSTAIREAAKDCLIQAGLVEAPEEEEMVRVEGAEYYTELANGFLGAVEVSIGVKDGKIVDVQAKGELETEGIGSKALEEIPAQILEAQTWEVDGVSSASLTSRAVKNAAKKAMIAAGLEEEE